LVDCRDQGQKPNLRGGGDGGGSKPWSSSMPDFSITTWARSPAGRARGTFDCGEAAGVGTATARGGGGELSSDTPPCSTRGVGVFAGFGVSSSFRASLDFPVFLILRAVSFSRDFFFADFGLGVGVWCRFDFGEALASGVSRGVGFGVGSSPSLDFALDFEIGLGDFFALAEGSGSFFDSSLASFARGMALGVSSGVADARCFLADFPVALFPTGLGDFLGFGDDMAWVSSVSD
jgi:hypothetical protein